MFQLKENNPVYVHTRVPFSEVSLKNLSNTELHSILEPLTEEEPQMFRELLSYRTNTFKVYDYTYFCFFIMLSVRELCFSNFFFPKLKSVCIGNFELSFPIYCKEQNVFNQYKKLAREANLYIRQ
jgi:hypothetical protein